MSRNNNPRKMGLQIARQTATIERQNREILTLRQELAFIGSHLMYHHPTQQTCPWERELMIKLDMAQKAHAEQQELETSNAQE